MHLAAVYDGAAQILYRNGQEVARRPHSGTIPDESTRVMLGAGDNGSAGLGEYLNAVLDDVRITNRALSGSEVQALYTGAGASGKTEPAAEEGAGEGGKSGGGSCGLLGLEVVLSLGLVWIRRGRQRTRPTPN